MTDAETPSEVEQGAIQHLEAALETDELDETNFHVRQALQLLGVE